MQTLQTNSHNILNMSTQVKIKRQPTQQPYLDKLDLTQSNHTQRKISENFAKSSGKKFFKGALPYGHVGYHERELDQILEDERNKYELQKITEKYEQILDEESRWD